MIWLAITGESEKRIFITLAQSDISTVAGVLECDNGWWWKLGGPYKPEISVGTGQMHWTEALKRALALMEAK